MYSKKIVMGKISRTVLRLTTKSCSACRAIFYHPKRPPMTKEIEEKFSEALRKS